MEDLFAALGLAVALEGAAYALFPGAMQRMLAQMQALPPQSLRLAGLAALLAGIAIVGLARRA